MDIEKELKIKNLYEKDTKISEILKICKCSSATVNKVREKYNLPKRRNSPSKIPINESLVVKLYTEGVILTEITKTCHCSTNTVSAILDKYNIPKRSQRINKKPNKDLSKFMDLTSPETQYWIGFICADGNINYNPEKRAYKVSLFSKDEEVIIKFIKYFGENTVCRSDRPTGIKEAYICSKELCEYFINILNITPNKSLTLNPNIEYTNNFILGYFDGDGSIRNSSEKQIRYECNITCASKIFLDKIKTILDKNDIYSIIYQHTDCNAYKIRIDRKSESEKFYHFLYKDAVVCLSRKLKNFVALYGNIENEKLGELQELKENLQPSQPLTKLEGSTTNS